jgi:peptide/nickel transport system permease protein
VTRYVLHRLLGAVAVLFVVSIVVFSLLRLAPGDPASVLAGPDATPDVVESIRQNLGLTGSVWSQYVDFLGNTTRLDFGVSFRYRVPAMAVVLERLPTTLLLSVCAVVLSLINAVIAGTVAARYHGSLYDRAISTVTLIGQSVPDFVLGLFLILIFAVQARLLPSFGIGGVSHLILPTLTLSAFISARQTRLIRTLMIDEFNKDYMRAGLVNGMRRWRLNSYLSIRNILASVIGLLTVDISGLFGGAVVVETVFSWPGLGKLLFDAVNGRDYTVLQAAVFAIAILVMLISVAGSMIQRAVDKRAFVEA